MSKISSVHIDFAKHKRIVARPGRVPAPARRLRLGLIGFVAILWSGLVIWRLYSLQISNGARWQNWAERQHETEIELASERGPIYDRSGKLLAVSVPAASIYVRPRQISDSVKVSNQIADALKLSPEYVRSRIKQDKPFVWITRQIPRSEADRLTNLNISGVGQVLEARRYYPYSQAASTLLGRVGLDGHGLSGIEMLHERQLRGAETRSIVTRDALGNRIEFPAQDNLRFELPKGQPLSLTLDAELQLIVDEELAAGRKVANAKRAMALLADANTGEVLALSQVPTVNFNADAVKSKRDLTNLLVETVYEPGSTLKPIVTAAALAEKLINTSESINCENGRYAYGGHVIKDVHPYGTIKVSDILIRSSNIGMTKIGSRLGKEKLHSYLSAFGFGSLSGLNLPGESAGILRSVRDWSQVDVATHSFGQGIAVTPLQMVRAISAIANGGKLPSLHVLKTDSPAAMPQIIDTKVAEVVRELMFGVVEDSNGTGSKAKVAGVRIGGKTGTAQKPRQDGRGYEPGAYMASFIGFADASSIGISQKLTLIVIIDEPKTNSIYGGTLAAPVFSKIMLRSLHALSTSQEFGSNDELAEPAEVAPTRPGQYRWPSGFAPVSYKN